DAAGKVLEAERAAEKLLADARESLSIEIADAKRKRSDAVSDAKLARTDQDRSGARQLVLEARTRLPKAVDTLIGLVFDGRDQY
ncbi:MAG: hypothetical protein WCT14_07535, partial [Treponemataceae bacterium]